MMGSNDGTYIVKPVHHVTIPRAIALGKYEVTFAQWDTCAADGGCNDYQSSDMRWGRSSDKGWGRGSRPVINVSWNDAQAYVSWLSRKTGKTYRLPSEAEWEYAARAGTTTRYWWGDDSGHDNANCRGCRSRSDNQTAPVGSFSANPFGLYDVHGNVWEWVEDCVNYSYADAPTDGRAWVSGNCSVRSIRGGSWNSYTGVIRAANRGSMGPGVRDHSLGFRVARTLVR